VTWLAALGRFIGAILAEMLPEMLKQWKKPRGVQVHGGDREVRDDIARQIEHDASRELGGTRIGPAGQGVAHPEDRRRGAGD
jgi:hypothetical protein